MPHTTEPCASVSPTVSHIVDSLNARIASGEFAAGDRLPVERSLAIEYGVSRTTLRNALICLEQLGCIDRLSGCRPVVTGRSADETRPRTTGRTNISIWITGEPNDVGAYSALQGVQAELDPDRHRLVVASPRGRNHSDSILSELEYLNRLCDDAEIAGAILWYLGGDENLPALRRIRAKGIPLVFLDRRPPDEFRADFVGVDNRHSARIVVEHLLNRGHIRIAHVTNLDAACTVKDRLAGYRDALEGAGIDFDPDLVVSGPFQEPEADNYASILRRLRGLERPPTAIFAVNDYSALCLHALAASESSGRTSEFEIAGFDDLERWRPGPGTITTARQPFERMGAHAARLLMDRIKTPQSQQFTSVIMDAPLIVRESCR